MIKINGQLHFYIPANHDIQERLLKKCGSNKGEIVDLYYYVIDHLYTAKYVNKKYLRDGNIISTDFIDATNQSKPYKELSAMNKSLIKKSYVPLNSRVRYEILTSRFANKVIKDLIEFRFIESDNHYEVGGKSKGYRLNSIIHENLFISKKVKNKALLRRIDRYKEKQTMACPEHLKKIYNNLFYFKYDYDSAVDFIYSYKETDPNKDEQLVKESMFYMSEKIKEQDFDFVSDKKSLRLFHTMSNIKRELRRFIRDEDGNKLIEVDIANCQPLLLAILYLEHKKENKVVDEIDKLYLELVTGGKLYDYIMDNYYQLELKLYDREKVRNKIKTKHILTYFFSETEDLLEYKMKIDLQVFSRIFPNISNFIKDCKNNYGTSGFSIKLQRMEAQLILNNVSVKLLDLGIKFITIHDSIMVVEKHVITVMEIIREVFEKEYGITPPLKVKYYN